MTVRQHRLSDPPYPSDYIYPADKDYPLNEDWEGGPVALLDTSEGLNNQAWHLTYNATGDPIPYNPDMMQYDGSTGYYDKTSITTAGNQVTIVGRFRRSSFTGGTFEFMYNIRGDVSTSRVAAIAWSSDYADSDRQDTISFQSQNTVSAFVCRLFTPVGYLDGNLHTFMYSFDATAGTAQLIIDGVAVDDIGNADRVAPTTGTLDSGSSSIITVGANVTGVNFFGSEIGFFGYRDAYLTNWSDFMTGNQPKQLDETTWTEWGAQPLFWNDAGTMDASIGTEGAMTKNGTITLIPAPPFPGDVQGFKVTPEDTGDPVNVLTGVDSVQCGLGFDQNAHVTIAWIDSVDVLHLYWYDTTVGNWIISDFDENVAGVGLTLDDKRLEQTGASDILLWYTLAVDGHHEIYTREQRDRFATVYPMQPGLPVWPYFKKLGMADELRVQMTMTNVGPV